MQILASSGRGGPQATQPKTSSLDAAFTDLGTAFECLAPLLLESTFLPPGLPPEMQFPSLYHLEQWILHSHLYLLPCTFKGS